MLSKSFAAAIFAFSALFMAIQAAASDVSPLEVEGAVTIDAQKAKELFDTGLLFVDTRKDSDWEAGRIPDAEHLELKSVFSEASLSEIASKDQPLVFYCNGEHCMRSSKACAMAVAWGFRKVYYFRDGFPAWKTAGYPVE